MFSAVASLIVPSYRSEGDQRGYGGNVANVAQGVGEVLSRLLRAVTDIPVVVLR